MKIAVYAKVLSERNLTGIGVYTFHMLRALSKIDRKNQYVLYSNEPIIHKIRADNFTEKILRFSRLWSYLRLPFEFIGDKYDLLFMPKEMVPPFKRPKTVVVCFDLMNLIFPDKMTIPAKVHFWIAIHYGLKSADRVIAISESTKKDVMKACNLSTDNIIVTCLGYDDELYRPYPDNDLIRKVKKKYGIRNRYLINASSVIWYRKNIPRLIKAFYACREKGINNHQLLITGKKGEAYEEVAGLIHSLGLERDVILTGYIPTEDMPVLFSGAEALVFPSLHEGFGLPIIEAMACGCPVITSNCSAMPEVTGDAGILIDPYNEEDIAAAIERVLLDPELRDKLRKKSLKHAQMFTWEKTARETLKVFESL